MNNCILMAEIVQEPQLRYTPDNQTPVAEMLVEFPGLREEEPPSRLKVVGWGNLAQEIQERYHPGDRVIIEGRLSMSTFDRPEGFKEKRAELTAQKIHLLGAGATVSTAAATPTPAAATKAPAATTAPSPSPAAPKASRATKPATSEAPKTPAYTTVAPDAVDYDDIPF